MQTTRFAHIKDQALIEKLLQKGLLSQKTVTEVLNQQNKGFQATTRDLKGILYEIHLASRHLQIKESLSLSALGEIELAPNHNSPYEPAHWKTWGQGVVLIEPRQAAVAGWLTESELPARGLVLSPQRSYLYSPELVHQPWLGRMSCLLDPHLSSQESPDHGPWDLFVSPLQQWICLFDRAAGDLSLISPQTFAITEIFSLREAGSIFSLNLAFDENQHQIYFTDQTTPYLSILDIQGGTLEQYTLDPEIPGNLWLDSSRQCLYLLICAPVPLLRQLDLKSLETLREVPLESGLWSKGGQAPTDLILLTSHSLVLLLRDPLSGQPRLRFLDPEDLSTQDETGLAGPLPPTQLAWAEVNPLHQQARKLADLLVDAGLIEAQVLLDLFPAPSEIAEEETVLEIIAPDSTVVEVVDAQGEVLSRSVEEVLAQQPSVSTLATQPSPRLAPSLLMLSPIESAASLTQPRRTENLPLPDLAEAVILQILSASFYAQTRLDVRQSEEALSKLRNQAAQARIRLQDFDAVRVFLPDLYQGKALQTVVLRDSVLTMLELLNATAHQPHETPPTHCPVCHTPLLGIWDCNTCGLQLLSPERALKRRLASADPQTWLPPSYFAIPDVNEGRLLLVNTQRFNYVTWQMNLKVLPGTRQPWDMRWLEDFHVLITDRLTNRVFEVDPGGREIWHLESEKYPELHLHEPVRATRYRREVGTWRYLIVDRGHHRVLEVSPDQKITWQWGQYAKPGNTQMLLDSPSDIQLTHELSYLITDTGNDRILEIRENRVFRVFGEYLDLKRPVAAQRLYNGQTLIADAGHHRLLIVDGDGQPVHECVYYRPGLDERFRMDEPVHMARRENQNVVLIDRNRVMEINIIDKKIVWFSFLHELQMEIAPPEMPATEIHRSETSRAFENFEEQPAPDIITVQRMLRNIPLFAGAPWHFFDKLEKILHLHTFQPGEIVLQKGRLGRSMFLILTGSVEILNAADQQAVMTLEAGDSFGYMGIIYSEPQKSDVRVRETATLFELEKKALDVLLEEYPEIARRRQELAQERMVISKLKRTPSSASAASRLQSLIARHKALAHQSLHSGMHLPSPPGEAAHQAHRLQYTELEQKLIQEASTSGYRCLELHVSLSRSTRMKAARISLIAHVLERFGTLIKTSPDPNAIIEEKVGTEVIFTLLTADRPEQIAEDLRAIAEVEGVAVLPVPGER